MDCGLFHTFNGNERPAYVASLASVTEQHGTLYVLYFSDDGPDTGPTHQSGRAESGVQRQQWMECSRSIEPDRIQTRYHDDGHRRSPGRFPSFPAYLNTSRDCTHTGSFAEPSTVTGHVWVGNVDVRVIQHASAQNDFGIPHFPQLIRLSLALIPLLGCQEGRSGA